MEINLDNLDKVTGGAKGVSTSNVSTSGATVNTSSVGLSGAELNNLTTGTEVSILQDGARVASGEFQSVRTSGAQTFADILVNGVVMSYDLSQVCICIAMAF